MNRAEILSQDTLPRQACLFYEAFGLVLQSDFAFPDMVETSRRDVDIFIHRTAMSDPFADQDFEWLHHHIGPDTQTFVWKTLGTYKISGGNRIDIDPVEDVDTAHLSIPLFGAVFATLLHMRGLLVLHASAVARDDTCVIFLGDKGAGKSTTALTLIANGYALLSDDVVAIDFDADGTPKVQPAFNQVKLMDDAAERFGLDHGAAEQIHPLVEKRRHQANGAFCTTAAKVAAIYVLDRDETARIADFTPPEALTHLIAFSYAARFGKDAFPASIAATHMQACAKLIGTAKVGKLIAPKTLEQIEDIVPLINDVLEI